MTSQPDLQTEKLSEQRAAELENPLLRDARNLPNLITVSRLVLSVILFALIYTDGFWITAAVVFLIAALTDMLDGYIARRYGMVTTLGRILDPFVDKIIICGAFVFLLGKQTRLDDGMIVTSGVNAWMVVIVIAREMFVTSLRGFLEQQGRDFSASLSGKLKMVAQCAAVALSLVSLSPRFGSETLNVVRDFTLWATVVVTVWSGLVYVQRAAVILRRPHTS